MPDYLTASDAARELTSQTGQQVSPRAISTLLYERALRDDLCPIVGGRRMIPRDYLPVVLMALRRRGLVRREVATS
jgi:hypothetical protein